MIIPTTKNLFKSHFRVVNCTRFTNREIDIISSMLNGHLHSKEIALILQISTKTIDNYITDILGKLGSSYRYRYQIIDFFKQYGEYSLLKDTYFNIILEQKKLQQLAENLNNKLKDQDFLVHIKTGDSELSGVISQIKDDLSNLGITVTQNNKQSSTIDVCLALIENKGGDIQISLTMSSSAEGIIIEDVSYGRLFISILRGLPISTDISQDLAIFDQLEQAASSEESAQKKTFFEKIRERSLLFYVVSITAVGAFLFIGWIFYNNEPLLAGYRGELFLPNEKKLLVRHDIFQQIDEGFKNQTGIKTVALVGVGGSGKTTIASCYASKRKDRTVWQVNAKNVTSLLNSYEEILVSISSDQGDFEKVRQLDNITNKAKKTKALLALLTSKLRSQPSWFLVIDNLQDFDDIGKYFPQDPKVWGKGAILITTRNKNIALNENIGSVIFVNELSVEEKIKLFKKDYKPSDVDMSVISDDDLKKFLESIPSYPLDVITCASYLNTTKISFPEYLSLIQRNQNEVADFEEVIMSSVTNYHNTRNNIIKASLGEMLKNDPKFGKILFFLSIIDNKNIPIKFIKLIEDNSTVDKFIFEMNKYSLITNTASIDRTAVISIHDKTHSVIKSYIEGIYKELHLDSHVNKIFTTVIANLQETVFEETNLPETKLLLSHYVGILQKGLDLKPSIRQSIYTEVGRAYFYIGNNANATYYLEKGLEIYKSRNNKEFLGGDLRLLSFIGDLYGSSMRRGDIDIDIPKLQEIIQMLEYDIKHQRSIASNKFLLEGIIYLGVLYQHLSFLEMDSEYLNKLYSVCRGPNIAQAIQNLPMNVPNALAIKWAKRSNACLEEAMSKFDSNNPKHARVGLSLHYVAVNYALLGNPTKAKEYVAKAHDVCLRNYSKENIRVGWSFLMTAVTYSYLGEYAEAIKNYKQCIENFKNHFPKDDTFLRFASVCLANALRLLGQYDASNKILKELISLRRLSENSNKYKELDLLIRNLSSQVNTGSSMKKNQPVIDGYATLLCDDIKRMDYFKDKKR